MGVKFACQHLLRRRDLSCTKVNAVNRLSDCLDASFGLRRRQLLLQQPLPGPGPASAGGLVGSKQIDAALQTGKYFEQVSPVS